MTIKKKPLSESKDELSVPDFIYNRYDIFLPDDAVAYECVWDNKTICVPVSFNGANVELGLWLANIETNVIDEVAKKIFQDSGRVRTISYQNSLVDYGESKEGNHFKIELPENIEELKARLSSKGRYNIQREKRIIAETFQGYTVDEYTPDNVPKNVFDEYFRMKAITHGTDYRMSANEYINKYHVSNIYVLNTPERILAVILSCEQCSVVYIENLTYEVEYSRYSPGQVLYDIYLERLIEKGKRYLYLAGGNLEYKRRYGSEENIVYSGIIYRDAKTKDKILKEAESKSKIEKIYSIMPEWIKNIYRKIK